MILNVLKRDGKTIVPYDASKIRMAILKANDEMDDPAERIDNSTIDYLISHGIENKLKDETTSVEEIQDMIERELMTMRKFKLAKAYITYRYTRALVRRSNTTDESILNLIKGENDELRRENSNKRPSLNSTQRDLIAGEVSKDITRRFLLPPNIIKAHDTGKIHFHDMDYFAQPEFNCCLPNFRDMLKNGTAIHGVAIETPKSFQVACTQVTQIMADVASNQYGGQTFYTDVLGEYLAYTRNKIRERVENEVNDGFDSYAESLARIDIDADSPYNDVMKKSIIDNIVERELYEQLKSGVQTIQYQINTLMTTNGQSPFVTLFMYLREDDPYLEENAMIIEEILRQRIAGVKNKAGVPVTPAFPKLVYVLTEQNCLKGGRFDYLTHLAAECTAKRMYPDYISEKIMKENYNGQVFGCMGCVKGSSMIEYKLNGVEKVTSIATLWDDLSRSNTVTHQNTSKNNWYIDTDNLEVWDTKKKNYTKVYRMIMNGDSQFLKVELDNGYSLYCTPDHPFSTENRGVVFAKDLIVDKDAIDTKNGISYVKSVEKTDYNENSYDFTTESKHFEVNCIYSHNCRSFLSEWIDPKTGEPQWEGRLTQQKVKPTLNDVNA